MLSLKGVRQFSTSSIRLNHPILSKLRSHPQDKVAIRHVPSGNEYTYGQLNSEITKWRKILKPESTVALMGENSFQFVAPFYASLSLKNTIAVPLCTNHTPAEIEYQLNDSNAKTIVVPDRFKHKVDHFGDIAEIISTENAKERYPNSKEEETDTAYMLYTSGTSGKPKGVVTPLETYMAQAKALTQTWDINNQTNFLQTLPLHHVHGLLIATTLPLLAGGRVEFLFPFSPEKWLERIMDDSLPEINTYTAVPTVYTRIISYLKELKNPDKARKAIGKKLKLAMCGSAALPDPLRKDWDWATKGKLSLLERYGMTETGITFSQPLDPSKRVAGSVGLPVVSVDARLVDPDTNQVSETAGEIQLTGPLIFKEYLNKPEQTKETFSEDGWFKTGDIAVKDKDTGFYHIQGRASMDIIKSGGEKISALEIERELLGLDEIKECSVVGIPSDTWGEEVTAIVALNEEFSLDKMKKKLKKVLAGWKIPKKMIVVEEIPRNQMGKVNKKQLVKEYM